MVDAMNVLGAAASAKLAGDRLVRDFVAYIRETRLTIPEPAPRPTRQRRRKARLSRPLKSSTSGLGRRPSSSRLSKKVSLMTDAELEAELENRRRSRAKERDMYSRAMRSDKLAALESELANLRREIGRIDPVSSKGILRTGTPHSVRWEPLPRSRRSTDMRGPFAADTNGDGVRVPPVRGAPTPSGPPPPPPPPPLPGANEDDGFTMDPEQRKREKAERQRRREAKKKEREQTQKKMTLADIIKSAGADPIKRLRPAGKKPADLEKEEFEKQKRDREEREKRQEQERIELEKKTMESMGRKVTEQVPETTEIPKNTNNTSEERGTAQACEKSSCAENAAEDNSATNESKREPKSDEDSSKLVDVVLLVSADESSKTARLSESACVRSVDEIQVDEVKNLKNNKYSESKEEQPSRSIESPNDTSPSSTTAEDQALQSHEENKKLEAREKFVNTREGAKAPEVFQVKVGSTVTDADTENVAPNASAQDAVLGDHSQRKIVDGDESIDLPMIS